tara:strand:+ start:225 stop:560 length:336 start_codon:yes stop_codon:yes gene_type:complete
MKNKILQYLQCEKNIFNLNKELKCQRIQKNELSKEIIHFCKTNNKSKINLPDGTTLNMNTSNSYQSLSYSYIEEKLLIYNKRHSKTLPVKDIIAFLKEERENKSNVELIHT